MKPIEASGRHTTDVSKPTPGVTTQIVTKPLRDAKFCSGEPQDVTEHGAGKPTPRVATPIVAAQPSYGIFGTNERRDAKENDKEN
jgi:hypothetical protein